ncbi:hypothetical protein SLOPH_1133 [Spraguea lophii 42_110]|uniref:Uncharacterized protein n=1 Tax=Spraguea lophii (strain 42_110) TaxID=1358809 RepID=S7W6Q2_SPRLO|nr:hypothetical protein SLOPH_1133 [Spraguea lophii 42_110]
MLLHLLPLFFLNIFSIDNIELSGNFFRSTLTLSNLEYEYIIIKHNSIFYPLTHTAHGLSQTTTYPNLKDRIFVIDNEIKKYIMKINNKIKLNNNNTYNSTYNNKHIFYNDINYTIIDCRNIKTLQYDIIKKILKEYQYQGKVTSGYDLKFIFVGKNTYKIKTIREQVFIPDFTIFPLAMNLCGSKFALVLTTIGKLYEEYMNRK